MFYATSDQISLLCPGNEFTERGWSAVARGHAYAGRNRLIQDKVMFEDRSLGTRARVSESDSVGDLIGDAKRSFRAQADHDRRAAGVEAEVTAARSRARAGERGPQAGQPGGAGRPGGDPGR